MGLRAKGHRPDGKADIEMEAENHDEMSRNLSPHARAHISSRLPAQKFAYLFFKSL